MRTCAVNETRGMTDVSTNTLYLDTNVFIMAVEGTGEAAAPAKGLMAFLRNRAAGIAVTSEITLAEVLATSKRPGAASLQVKRPAYLDLLVWSGFFSLLPVSRSILLETAELRAAVNLKLPDAIHLASALQAGCRYFVTADKDFDGMPKGIERVNCDQDSMSRLIQDLS